MRSLPKVVSNIPNDLRAFVDRVREYIANAGDDSFVTKGDLVRAGVISTTPGGGIAPPGSTVVQLPTVPTGLTASGALATIILTWDAPNYSGHLETRIWSASTDDFDAKVLVGASPGTTFSHSVGSGTSRYYWIQHVNLNLVEGPFNGEAGTLGTTGSDPAYLLDVLDGSITETQLYSSLNNRIDLIDGSATTIGTIPYQLALLQGQIDTLAATPAYDNSTTYAIGDIVQYSGGLYQAIASTTGNLPTDTTYWLKIGDYSSLGDAVAAHTTEIATLTTDLGSEVSAREALASQMRGTYTGTDITLVSSGLIYSEREARTTAVSAEVTARETLAAQMRGSYTGSDLTLLTSGLLYSEREARTTADSAEVTARETLAAQVRGTYTGTDIASVTSGLLYSEKTARATADSAEVTARETLAAQVRGTYTGTDVASVTSGLLYSERTARATADSALASDISTLSTTVGNQTTSLQTLSQSVDGIKGLYTVKIDNNGSVGGFGLESVLDNAGISLWAASTYYAIGAVRRVSGVSTKVMRCTVAGTSGTSTPTLAGAVGTTFIDGSVTWEIASSTATSTFISNVDKFAVTTPSSSIPALARSTAYTVGQFTGPNFVAVRVATTANVTLSGLQTIDGVALVAGNRVLVKNQTTAAQNGVYVVASGAWTRATDADTWTELYGLSAKPTEGAGAGIIYTTSIPSTGTLNTTNVVFTVNSKLLVCKVAGTTAATITLNMDSLTIGTTFTDGTVVWQVSSVVPFSVLTSSQTINGVTVPPGVYIDGASIVNATINNAQIANLAVDSAKIADGAIVAAKIGNAEIGSAQIADTIQSTNWTTTTGWQINKAGTATFNEALIRGSIYGGSATAYTTGTGLFAGLDSSVYKFRVGNPSGNQLTWDGTTLAVTGSLAGSTSGAATTYSSGTGLFAGLDSSVYKFRVGTTTGNRMYWDGTSLVIVGSISGSTTGAATTYSSGTGLFAGLDSGTYKFRVGTATGDRVYWDGTNLGVSGTLVVNTAAVSGTTMTGSGAVINSTGTFALGNNTTNISFNGTTMTLNGNVVGTPNIQTQAVSKTASSFTAGRITSSGASLNVWYDVPGVSVTITNNSTSATAVIWVSLDATQAGSDSDIVRYRILRVNDSTALPGAPNFKADGQNRVFSYNYVDLSPPGSTGGTAVTYKLQTLFVQGLDTYIDGTQLVVSLLQR